MNAAARKRRPAPAVVGARVDWLEVAFRLEHDEATLKVLRLRGEEAIREDAPTAVSLGDWHDGPPVERWRADALATEDSERWVYGKAGVRDFELMRPSKDGKWLLRNRLMRVEVLERGPGGDADGSPGWTVRVAMSGTAMLEMGHRGAVLEAWAVARSLGRIVEARFGRIDLCCDVANYDLRPDDRASFVKARRVKSGDHFQDGTSRVRKKRRTNLEGETVREETLTWHVDGRRIVDDDNAGHVEMYGGDTFTGFVFGCRTAMSARIYDKPLQLRAQVPDKRLAEERNWAAHGWDGAADVARVEFEFRGESLDELKLRQPLRPEIGGAEMHAAMLAERLDPVWAYATAKAPEGGKCKGWLRLVRRGESHVIQPRWRAVQEATFVRAAEPTARIRKRGFAKAAQARGAAMGFVASIHEMPGIPWPVKVNRKTGQVDTRRNVDRCKLVEEFCRAQGAKTAEEGEALAAWKLHKDLAAVFSRAYKGIAKAEIERAGGSARGALSRVWTHWGAVLARVGPDYDGGEFREEGASDGVVAA